MGAFAMLQFVQHKQVCTATTPLAPAPVEMHAPTPTVHWPIQTHVRVEHRTATLLQVCTASLHSTFAAKHAHSASTEAQSPMARAPNVQLVGTPTMPAT